MAPEQITMPEAVDHRADIYSTGVVFYEMLARELPGPDRVPPSRKAATDPRLDPIVLRAIERERDRRYQEARLMHRDITDLARTPESTIRLEKHIPAPPAQVFAVWIDPGQMADWYAPPTISARPSARSIRRSADSYRVGMLLPGRTEPRFVSGQYCRVDAPRTLSFTWAWEPHKAGWNETQVTVEFHPRGRRHRPGVDPRALPGRAGQERPRPGLAGVPRSPGPQVRGLMDACRGGVAGPVHLLQPGGAFGTAKLRWCAAWMQWNRSHSSRVRGPKRTWGTTGPGEAL